MGLLRSADFDCRGDQGDFGAGVVIIRRWRATKVHGLGSVRRDDALTAAGLRTLEFNAGWGFRRRSPDARYGLMFRFFEAAEEAPRRGSRSGGNEGPQRLRS